MKLQDCESKQELEIKELVLANLTNVDLINLAGDIEDMFENQELKNEKFVINALYQITEELFSRINTEAHYPKIREKELIANV